MITIDPIKRPPKGSSSVDTEEIMKEIDQKIEDALNNNDSQISCIPLVEELDPDAPLGILVRYKQDISFDKIETVTKEISIRELNQFPDKSSPQTLIESADIIRDLNFKIPSEYPRFNEPCHYDFGFFNASKQATIIFGAFYDEESYSLSCLIIINNKDSVYNLIYNNTSNNDLINNLKNQYLNTELYYMGIDPNTPITEEGFDLIDCFITVDTVKEIKTTEEITKVVPYIKQQHGWESLITENSDFNNDFNLDFN